MLLLSILFKIKGNISFFAIQSSLLRFVLFNLWILKAIFDLLFAFLVMSNLVGTSKGLLLTIYSLTCSI